MILVVDVGNTNIVLGLYRGTELLAYWRVSTVRERTADEYGVLLRQLFSGAGLALEDVTAVVISSVVPSVDPNLEWMCQKYLHRDPLMVEPGTKTGMVIRYENPREVGADRVVNAIAAYEKYGGPVIVVDFGTATTFDAISKDGEYLGGAIAPGIGISSEALFQHAAKLWRVELVKPRSVIGKNTAASMQSGIIFGFAGQVDELVRRIKKELGGGRIPVIATGGEAELIASEAHTIDKVDPLLTLEGLRVIYERNQPT